jgi:hypothetical protein
LGCFRNEKKPKVSSFSIVHDVSLELRRRIFAALDVTPDTDFGLNNNIDRIRIAPPGEDLPSGTLAALFLYHLDIDRHLRNQRPLPDRSDASLERKPPLPLQFRFLFTPVDDDDSINHLVLGRVLQHFYDEPFITTIANQPLDDSFGGASPALRVKPDMLTVEQLSQLWNALSTPFRLSIGLLVDIAAVDSGEPPHRAPRVEELLAATGIGGS